MKETKTTNLEINILINSGLYKKDPQGSKLGKKIIRHSILMIDEYGLEAFTFKKLASEIGSTEASIYRYFENKHKLLLFLINWYWEWVNFLIEENIKTISEPRKQLKAIIHSFVFASQENPNVSYVNESKLQGIFISEGGKAYHTKEVDVENQKGFFQSYKRLATTVSNIIMKVNPDFKYPHALATNLFEMSNNHIYFAKHLPKLTDISSSKENYQEVEDMLNYFVNNLLKTSNP